MLLALLAVTVADLEVLRVADLRVATIGQRLVTRNAALCPDAAPAPGLVLHGEGQYARDARATARAAFGFAAPLSVEAIVPGSAAARAGVRANDGVVTIDGVAVTGDGAGTAPRDRALARIALLTPTAPIRVTLRRDGREATVVLPPSAGCRATFEIADATETAFSDGNAIQIGTGYLARWNDDQIAVLLAHELAHNILRHRARLAAAKVAFGAEFGRSGRLNRRAEAEADLLSVHLLRNAGWDPAIAERFWREEGPKADGGLFRSRIYAGAKARARAIAAEIRAIPAGAPTPYAPPLLATRDEPMK